MDFEHSHLGHLNFFTMEFVNGHKMVISFSYSSFVK